MRGARRQLTPFNSIPASLDVFHRHDLPIRRRRRHLVLTDDDESTEIPNKTRI
jgi:hypothetical protein